jgi:hypothetical protein
MSGLLILCGHCFCQFYILSAKSIIIIKEIKRENGLHIFDGFSRGIFFLKATDCRPWWKDLTSSRKK